MTFNDACQIVAALQCYGYEAEVYDGYRGRGMSIEVPAVVTECPIMFGFCAREHGLDVDDVPTRVDQMGRDQVVIY